MDKVTVEQKKVSKRKIQISKLKRRLLKHLWLVRIGLIAGVILGIYLSIILIGAVFQKTQIGYYAGLASDFIFTPSSKIESLDGRTNLLILGKGGQGHEAPDLTDTIIFASVAHDKPLVSMVSLSRDIWVPEFRAKLNATYYWGNQKEKGGGMILAKSQVEKIVGTPVFYGIVIDFSGFKKIVDVLGGIEVSVERSFTDERYPIPGFEDDECGGDDPEFLCRYETISFKEGNHNMDGEAALKFARSRNAEGEEGTDFARAARQEKVLAAIKNKALSRKIILNPKKVIDVTNAVLDSIETDMDPSAAAILARKIFEARDNIVTQVLPEKFLENPPQTSRYDGLFVFIPKDEMWGQVHEWVDCILKNGGCD